MQSVGDLRQDFDLLVTNDPTISGCDLQLEEGYTRWELFTLEMEKFPIDMLTTVKRLVPEIEVAFSIDEDQDGHHETVGYIEDGEIKEGYTDADVEEMRAFLREYYRTYMPAAEVLFLPSDADESNPQLAEMLKKGYYVKDKSPVVESTKYDVGTAFAFCKKILFIDMDNVLVDFQSGLNKVDEATKQQYEGHLDDIPGIFALMEPMPGAIEGAHRLAERYDCYILSTAPWENPSAWSDKLLWVKKYLGELFYKRLIISHHKNLCHGDYLIDDRGKNGIREFEGEWIQFGSPEYPDWESVVNYLNI